jgi:hypothetical protein
MHGRTHSTRQNIQKKSLESGIENGMKTMFSINVFKVHRWDGAMDVNSTGGLL